MQRVLKYPLIVKRLMGNSGESHPDYHDLNYVHETLLDLNNYINRTKADMERTIKPMEILQAQLDGRRISLPRKLSDYGALLMDCMASRWGDITSSNRHKIHIFVFNMAVVVFEMTANETPTRQIWNMHVQEISPGPVKKMAGLRIFGTNGYEIKLKVKLGSGDQTVLLKSEKDAKDFVEKIKFAKTKCEVGGDEWELCDVPSDQDTGELPTCCACQKLFHGIKSQGYRNRKRPAERIFVHGKCIAKIDSGELELKGYRLSTNSFCA